MGESERAWLEGQEKLARECVAAVLADVERTTERRPTVAVDQFDGSVRILTPTGFASPCPSSDDPSTALVKVAAYLQEWLSEPGWLVWPVCASHDAGLVPRARAGRAVWSCPLCDFTAPIGQLPHT